MFADLVSNRDGIPQRHNARERRGLPAAPVRGLRPADHPGPIGTSPLHFAGDHVRRLRPRSPGRCLPGLVGARWPVQGHYEYGSQTLMYQRKFPLLFG